MRMLFGLVVHTALSASFLMLLAGVATAVAIPVIGEAAIPMVDPQKFAGVAVFFGIAGGFCSGLAVAAFHDEEAK